MQQEKKYGGTNMKQPNSIHSICLFIVFCTTIGICGTPLKTGTYWNGMTRIGVDGDILTGSIDVTMGQNGAYVCQFYFNGVLTGKTFPIACHNFEDTGTTPGTVTVLNDSSFYLKLKENVACSYQIADLKNKGTTINLSEAKAIKQVRIVTVDKAFFYSEPDISTKKKAYLIRSNEAIVSERKDGWLKVTYGKTTGWMLENDMVPLR